MKKTLISLLALIPLALPAFAEPDPLYPAHRIFEIGFADQFSLENNTFDAKSFLVKNLVIDVNKIVSEMPSDGLVLGASFAAPASYWNLNLKNGLRLGEQSGLEGSACGSVGKDLFEFLANGNGSDGTISGSGSCNADVFAYDTITAGYTFGKLRVTASQSLFIPLLHAQTDSLSATVTNPSDGSVKVAASAKGTIYSFTSLAPIGNGTSVGGDDVARDALSSIGIDIAGAAEYPVFPFLIVGGYARIPFIPGRLNYAASGTATMTYSGDKFTDIVNGNATTSTSVSDVSYTSETYYISRPLRMGGELAFRPFGNWYTMRALLGFGVQYPFSDSAKLYPEYSLGLSVDAFKIVGLELSTSYLSQTFVHKLGFMLNCRVLEINMAALLTGAGNSSSAAGWGTALISSFKGTGMGMQLSVSMGW